MKSSLLSDDKEGGSTNKLNNYFLEFNMLSKLRTFLDLLVQIAKLPVAHLHFDLDLNPDDIRSTYEHFTKPHAKYKIFKNKSLGAALIDLRRFDTREEYMKTHRLNARNAKKAKSRGYMFCEIDRNNHINDIYEINTSLEDRQGRSMDASYLERVSYYEPLKNYKYYGILNRDGRLMAYCNLGICGDFAIFNQLLAYRSNDRIMNLLMLEAVSQFINDSTVKYIMYDTYFGANAGLKEFKTTIGCSPYRARYHIK